MAKLQDKLFNRVIEGELEAQAEIQKEIQNSKINSESCSYIIDDTYIKIRFPKGIIPLIEMNFDDGEGIIISPNTFNNMLPHTTSPLSCNTTTGDDIFDAAEINGSFDYSEIRLTITDEYNKSTFKSFYFIAYIPYVNEYLF